MEACSFGICPSVTPLHLALKKFLAVRGKNIKPDSTAIYVWHSLLSCNLSDRNPFVIQNNAQQQIHALNIIVEAYIKENIVNEPQSLHLFEIKFAIVKWQHINHLLPSF